METGVINAMCRCCASEGAFKDFKSAYHWMGEEEVYADMLRECFDITLSTSEDGFDGGICEVCITQLRNASNFKKQVLLAEDQFKKHVQNKLFKPNIVKVEMSPDEDSDGLSGDDTFSTEFEVPIKEEETLEEPKGKKRGAKATTSKGAKKSKNEAGESSTKRKFGGNQFRLTPEVFNKEITLHDCNQTGISSHSMKQHYRTFTCSECHENFANNREVVLHKLNIHNIDERFKCNACPSTFIRKEHLNKHIKNYHILGVKMKCKECSYETFDIESLKKHGYRHKKVRDFACQYCNKRFVRKSNMELHERIHTGDRRNVCLECGEAFVQKSSLNYHIRKNHPEIPL